MTDIEDIDTYSQQSSIECGTKYAAEISAYVFQGRKLSGKRKRLPGKRNLTTPNRRVLAGPIASIEPKERLLTVTFEPYPYYAHNSPLGQCELCSFNLASVMVERMRGPTKTRDYKNICADCTGVALFKAMCTAERYNLAIYNGDDFEHSGDIRGIEVAVAMDLFRQKYQQRRKGKDVE